MTCSVIGNNTAAFPFDYENDYFKRAIYTDKLYNIVESLICSGYDHFITGLGKGADMDFGGAVLYFKSSDYSEYNITLESVMPGPRTGINYPDEYWESYDYIVSSSDIVTKAVKNSKPLSLKQRKEFIIDHSDLVLYVWNGSTNNVIWDTIQYAKKNNKKIRYLMLNEIHV